MNAEAIQTLVKNAIEKESSQVEVKVQGEGASFQVTVVSDLFDGLNSVKRQQAVYKILNPFISSGEIHAVTMALSTPGESQ